MRLGRLFGIPVRISPAALFMAALAIWLGEGQRLAVMSSSILLHELAHIAAARLLRVRVIELEMMPIGGAARLENLWRLRPSQVTMVALAGPMANLLLMVISAALCQWKIMPDQWAAMMIEQNAVICVFNLLPALPMDGGRVLCGLLSCRMSISGAAKVGRCVGQGLAAALLGMSAYGLMQGRLNITLPAAAVFLLMSARREQRQAEGAVLESLMGRFDELHAETVLPMRWLAVRTDATVRETAIQLRPRYMHRIAVYDDALNLAKVVEERELLLRLLENGDVLMENVGVSVKNVNSTK